MWSFLDCSSSLRHRNLPMFFSFVWMSSKSTSSWSDWDRIVALAPDLTAAPRALRCLVHRTAGRRRAGLAPMPNYSSRGFSGASLFLSRQWIAVLTPDYHMAWEWELPMKMLKAKREDSFWSNLGSTISYIPWLRRVNDYDEWAPRHRCMIYD